MILRSSTLLVSKRSSSQKREPLKKLQIKWPALLLTVKRQSLLRRAKRKKKKLTKNELEHNI